MFGKLNSQSIKALQTNIEIACMRLGFTLFQ